ncbi:hypothetical protein NTE_03088 [Candidatus Nitrososphaera evergladensis SR1]|uniref:Uncharacterized protein n=1 Tax=Candidatus Nitrososphaera evergladensis SR1 TaxID=1459636 RepID=A0A075MWU6_9ARCH|nr:hypothetical protein [Candidatus Nitrososphaera evergladensis]AIF85122.1 hypothetical protein NTE_03088 [Candidatus Nitrososphaera evergladensis SR1]
MAADKDDDEDNDSNNIIDILDTPDVAVWAKGIGKGAGAPSDRVKEPSKIVSMMPHIVKATTKKEGKGGMELMIDPASKKDMAKVSAEHASLTDESDYAR